MPFFMKINVGNFIVTELGEPEKLLTTERNAMLRVMIYP